MRGAILVIAALSATAVADKQPTPLSATDQKAYTAGLKSGRAAQQTKNWSAAIAAFTAALKVAPDDATLLGELGWTQYQAKDLPAAEASTRKALAGVSTPSIRGATLYNLGLIEEAKHDSQSAIAAYRESLQVRPNGIVRRALAKLDPSAAAAFDPFKPVAMEGPFASVAAYCATTPKQMADEGFDCSCGQDDTSKVTRHLAAPYQAVETFTHACGHSGTANGINNYGLAVKVASGWYVTTMATVRQNRFCNDSMQLADASTNATRLLVKLAIGGDCMGGNGGQRWSETGLVIVGGSRPAATPLVAVTKHETESDVPYDEDKVSRVSADIALELVWGSDNSVTVSGKTKGLDANEATNLIGKHTLVFP
ncbi:MAG TPA: tetratricopeptide repeat protein [Kofleriaceae bacterium]|nr:tetratricopeptide repeat protein [Kofleriaceae bacterium]